MRGNLAVVIIEEGSTRPISDAVVEVDRQQGLTDNSGRVQFNRLRLGNKTFSAYKNGYSRVEAKAVNSLGTTNVKPVKLKVIGVSFSIDVKNWLSGEAIKDATIAFKDQKSTTG